MKTKLQMVCFVAAVTFAACPALAGHGEKPPNLSKNVPAKQHAVQPTAEQQLGATEKDYQWWRDARFGIFIHWGPGALVHRNSLSWQKPANRPSWDKLGYMADHHDAPIPLDTLRREADKYAEQRTGTGTLL